MRPAAAFSPPRGLPGQRRAAMPAPRLSAADAQSDDDEVPWVPEDSCRQQLDEFWSSDAFGLRKYQVNCHPVEPFSENDPLEA